MTHLVDQFVDALLRLEESGDLDVISSLFSQDAQLSNPLVRHSSGEESSAKAFWSAYRGAFEHVRSSFRHVVRSDNAGMLEWTSEGSIDGNPFSYDGVSVIEFDGDRITAFRAYFDPRLLLVRGGGEEPTPEQNEQKEDDLVDAQREGAELRAAGGYS